MKLRGRDVGGAVPAKCPITILPALGLQACAIARRCFTAFFPYKTAAKFDFFRCGIPYDALKMHGALLLCNTHRLYFIGYAKLNVLVVRLFLNFRFVGAFYFCKYLCMSLIKIP